MKVESLTQIYSIYSIPMVHLPREMNGTEKPFCSTCSGQISPMDVFNCIRVPLCS